MITNNVKLKTLNGDEFKFPKNSYIVLKEAFNRAQQKLDNVIVYTGGVGSGKSNFSKGCNGVYNECIRKVPFTLDDTYFLIDDVLKAFDRDDNKYAVINYDEAIQGASGRDGISKLGKKLRTSMITKRTKRHLISFCVDNPKELNDKVIERTIAWYHIYMKRTKKGKYVKGLFKVFSKADLRTIYNDLKNYKYRFVEEHPIFKRNRNVYKSYDYSDLFYSEEEYDKKKATQTSSDDDEKKAKPKVDNTEDKKKALQLLEDGKTQYEVAAIIGRSRSWVRDTKQEAAAANNVYTTA